MKRTVALKLAHVMSPDTNLPNPDRFKDVCKAALKWGKKHPNPFSWKNRKKQIQTQQ